MISKFTKILNLPKAYFKWLVNLSHTNFLLSLFIGGATTLLSFAIIVNIFAIFPMLFHTLILVVMAMVVGMFVIAIASDFVE